MAVIIRRKAIISGKEVVIKTFQPSGTLSKEAREKAEELDKVLEITIPEISKVIEHDSLAAKNIVYRWFLLGRKLKEFVLNPPLVSSADISSGVIREAIWFHLPDSLKPKGSFGEMEMSSKKHKRKDHLSLCLEIASFDWNEVSWIERWDDWQQLSFRPASLKDKRIFDALRKEIQNLSKYPDRQQFRNIAKQIAEHFPQQKPTETKFLSDEIISNTVHKIVEESISQ